MRDIDHIKRLCNELHDTTSFLYLALSIFAEVSRANDERDLWNAAFAENFAVAEREEIEDWCSIALLACEVFFALFLWDE